MEVNPTAISLFGTENFAYLFIAALFGAWGLVTDSKDALIGSMLISPFFVPIINMSLKKKLPHPLVNNMAILLGSVLLSVLIGAATSKILNIDDSKETTLMKRIVNWNQSSSAATVFAYLIPLLSGVVIAIAYKNQNVISMVGAGIAISLLPPFVNTGLYLGQNADKKFEVSQSFKFGMVNLIAGIIGYGATVQYFRR